MTRDEHFNARVPRREQGMDHRHIGVLELLGVEGCANVPRGNID
jgi:hypothetical protein